MSYFCLFSNLNVTPETCRVHNLDIYVFNTFVYYLPIPKTRKNLES